MARILRVIRPSKTALPSTSQVCTVKTIVSHIKYAGLPPPSRGMEMIHSLLTRMGHYLEKADRMKTPVAALPAGDWLLSDAAG